MIVMGLFKFIVIGLWYSLFFLGAVILGDTFFPGKLASTVFSPLGILIFFVVFTLDAIFVLSPTEPNKEVSK